MDDGFRIDRAGATRLSSELGPEEGEEEEEEEVEVEDEEEEVEKPLGDLVIKPLPPAEGISTDGLLELRLTMMATT